jgi:LysM repeat protein
MFSPNFFPQHDQNQRAIEEKPSADEAGARLHLELRNETLGRVAPREATAVEKQSGTKRCKRCHGKYTESTNAECWYHSGKYESVSARKGLAVGWSCCREQAVLEANLGAAGSALNRVAPLEERAAFHAKGCKRAARHVEDEIYTRTILNFPYRHGAEQAYEEKMRKQLEEGQRLHGAKPVPDVVAAKERVVSLHKQEEVEIEYWRHTVSPFDTLPGLALRYDVSADEIRRLNGVHGAELHGKRELLIPVSEEVGRDLAPPVDPKRLKQFQLAAFKRQTGVCDEEARYYFAEANDSLKEALAMRERDLEFERHHKQGTTVPAPNALIQRDE